MSVYYAIRGYFRNCKGLAPFYGIWNPRSWMKCTRHMHFLPAGKRQSFSRPVLKSTSKRVNQTTKKNVDKKQYMRDIVIEISNILRYSSWDSAQEQLEKFHMKWDSYTVNQVLKTHPPLEKAWLFFNWASKQRGFKHDQFTYTTMMDIFGEAKRINSMMYVFHQMQEKGMTIDAVTYTSLLHWLSNVGDFDGAVKVWEEMKANQCCPTVVSYTAYMKVLFDNNRVDEATSVYKQMLQAGLSPTCHTYTILMAHLVRSGKCKSALEVFDRMPETGVQPDKATCNILIEACSKAGEACGIIHILHYMKDHSLVLRYPIYLQAHETLKRAGEDDMLLRQVNPHIHVESFDKREGLKLEECTLDVRSIANRGLLIELLRKKNFIAIDFVLAGMCHNTRLDAEIVSKIVEGNCALGRTNSALLALRYSKDRGINVNHVAYLSMIGLLIRENEYSEILHVVEQMVNVGYLFDLHLASTLIYRLGRGRALDKAVKVFNLLPKEIKNNVVCTSLLDACFSAGEPEKGIKTFKDMKDREIHKVLATYDVLIRGLEMCGRSDEADFYRMEKKSLRIESYGSESDMEGKLCNILFSGYMVL